MTPTLWQITAHYGMRDNSAPLLLRRKRAHQRQAGALLVFEQARAGERSGIGIVRFGTQEARRQHHLAAKHQAVEAQVMTEELPAPRLGFRRRAEQAEDEGPLTQ